MHVDRSPAGLGTSYERAGAAHGCVELQVCRESVDAEQHCCQRIPVAWAASSRSRFRTVVSAIVWLGVLLASASATAQPVDERLHTSEHTLATADDEAELKGDYYGWQALLSDVAGFGFLWLSQELGHGDAPAWIGVSLLTLGAPAIHAVHQNWSGLGISLALRFATGAAFIGGLSVLFDSDDEAQPGGFVLIACSLVGAISAVFSDAVILGFEPQAERPARPTHAFSLSPRIDPKGGAGLTLIASF